MTTNNENTPQGLSNTTKSPYVKMSMISNSKTPIPITTSAPKNTNTSQTIFSKSSLIIIISIMVLYGIFYAIFRLFLGETVSIAYKGVFIDILVAILVLYLIVNFNVNYFSGDGDPIGKFLVWLRNYYDNISNLFLTILVIIFFYLFVYVIQVPMDAFNKPYSMVILTGLIWGFLFIQLFNVLCIVMFGFSFADAILDPFIKGWYSLPSSSGTPAPLQMKDSSGNQLILVQDLSGIFQWLNPDRMKEKGVNISDLAQSNITTTPAPTTTAPIRISVPQSYYGCSTTPPLAEDGNEVFNISNNLYTYDEANAICQVFDARLATYDEVENAYNDGGEWCNYGWSANQMALFPTQKDTWNRLQQTATHKNDCGRPGVNGGYMDNPNLKFGVNCYGKKPKYTEKDISGSVVQFNNKAAAVSVEEQARIDYWKAHKDDIRINSFNMANWSEYYLPPVEETTNTPAPSYTTPPTTYTTTMPMTSSPQTTMPMTTSPQTTMPMTTTPTPNTTNTTPFFIS